MLTFDPIINLADFVSLLIALVALVVSLVALHRSDRTSSAGTLVSVYDSISSAWARFLVAEGDAKQSFELAELLNRLEVACAMSLGGGIHGAAKELLDDYVENSLIEISTDGSALQVIHRFRQRSTTFKYIVRFIGAPGRQVQMADVCALFEQPPPENALSG